MGDHKTLGTTVPGSSTHGSTGQNTRSGVVWAFPLPNKLTTPFEGTRILLGRSEACDVVLEGAEISRRHAELLRIGTEWVIHDLGSRNGVHVDARRVEHSVCASVTCCVWASGLGSCGRSRLAPRAVPRISANWLVDFSAGHNCRLP